jgi:hypothetical protein
MDITSIAEAIVFPAARILPFMVAFLLVRRIEDIVPSRIRRTIFYTGLFFGIAGAVGVDVGWYVFEIQSGNPAIYLVIELLNLVGALFLCIFANLVLLAFGKRGHILLDTAYVAFISTSLLAIFLAIAAKAFLTGMTELFITPLSYFFYAFSLFLIYEIYEKLSIKFLSLALIGSFLMVLSIIFSIMPDLGLFLEGAFSGVDVQQTYLIMDILQITGCILASLPIFSFYRSKKFEMTVEGAQELGLALYLQRLVDAYGKGILKLFNESFKDCEKDGTIKLRGDESNAQIERFMVELCKRYGKVPVEIAKGMDGLRPIAERVEFYYLRAG